MHHVRGFWSASCPNHEVCIVSPDHLWIAVCVSPVVYYSWRNIAFTILCVVQDQVVFVDPRRFHGDGAALLYTTHRPTAQLQRSFCTSASGKHVQALHEIELSLKFLPYCPSSLFWRGFLLLKDGARVDDAYECFKLLLKINDEWLDLVGDFARVFFVVFPF